MTSATAVPLDKKYMEGIQKGLDSAFKAAKEESFDPQRERSIDRRAAQRAPHHERPRRGDVGQVGQGREQGAGDEAGLHRDGQARAAAVAERPLARERGQDRGGAEPEREREQLREREQPEGPPASGVPGAATGRGNRSTRRGGRRVATSRAVDRTRP